MLTSTALVLFMTIPGLSLFYAGMVRSKNALSVMMQCFVITCLVTVLWVVYLYALAFGDDVGGIIGNLDKGVPQRHHLRHAERHDSRIGVLDLPADVRDHHARR